MAHAKDCADIRVTVSHSVEDIEPRDFYFPSLIQAIQFQHKTERIPGAKVIVHEPEEGELICIIG